MSEDLVNPDERYVLLPIEYPSFWKAYKDQQASFWTAEEVDLSEDLKHFQKKLTDGERRLLARVLGFFASSDTIVAQNIDTNFVSECGKRGWKEAEIAYDFQKMMENIHTEAYSDMIDKIIPERDAREELFDAIKNVPSINAKANWALKWMGRANRFTNLPSQIQQCIVQLSENTADALGTTDPDYEYIMEWINAECPTFGERLVAFVCVEAIFFSTSFAVIFYFKKRGLLPGVCFANELIARDEGMHHQFGTELVLRLAADARAGNPLGEIVPPERILEIVRSCVELEQAFVRDSLPVRLAGINEDKMCQYAEFVADRVLLDLGCERFFYAGQRNPKNPCEWMESIGLHHKTNFFERRVSSYQRRGVKQTETNVEDNMYRDDADF